MIIIEGTVLRDIGSYKNNIIIAFQNSPDICELLFDGNSYSSSDVKNLPFTQIFPYFYVDETQTEMLSYIGVEIDIPRIPTNTIKDMKVIIWAYCHKKLIQYKKKGYNGTRVDILSDMIERQLRNSNKFGIGKMNLESATYFFPNREYYGRQLIFSMPDFKIGR